MLDIKNIKTGRNLYKKHALFYEESPTNNKAYRSEESSNAILEIDGVTLNVSERSMDRMDRVIDVANWNYNRLVSQNDSEPYNNAYVNETIEWKDANGVFQTLTIETLCKFQKEAIKNLTEIWKKY